ncbi:histidinol phosphate phosphatase H [Auricularia subglabra TFB-10046 SS5]|nr:histidinol phosphate phosphatase H [Auricularia subglabra TFB-10046 SS5]
MHSHHSHSGQFCRHAAGQLEDVVKTAIERGFTVYGLSEHMPRYRPQDLYPEESDLSITALEDTFRQFISEARRLKQVYKDRISLLVGLETEHIISSDLDDLQRLLDSVGGVDYMVGSVHHAGEIPIDFDEPTFQRALLSASPSGDEAVRWEALCCQYFDAQYELLQRVRPTIIGHFDLCRLYRPSYAFAQHASVWTRVRRNVEFAVSYGALFEANAAAFRKGWSAAYPGPDVATKQLILELGGRFVLSDDSHGPHAVGLNYPRLREYLLSVGVRELWFLAERTQQDGTTEVVPEKVQGEWWEDPFWRRVSVRVGGRWEVLWIEVGSRMHMASYRPLQFQMRLQRCENMGPGMALRIRIDGPREALWRSPRRKTSYKSGA